MALHLLLGALLGYLALELILYWLPLLAARKASPPAPPPVTARPRFAILTPCRNGAPCVPGLVQSFRAQDYPADQIDLYMVADHCTDNSAALARSLGVFVEERRAPQSPGKGPALTDFLRATLAQKPFDVLVVLDIDSRVEPDFIGRAARHVAAGAEALSCATRAKNPDATLLAHVGSVIQDLLRLHQRGRAALGWDAAFHGSHGYVLARSALERLDYRLNTGLQAEDMELRLRCSLAGLRVRYAPDLIVRSDVTTDPQAVREQRRRWNSTYLPLIPAYAGRLLRRGLSGHARCLEALFGLLLLPSFANLFLYLSAVTVVLGVTGVFQTAVRPWAVAASLLWLTHLLYFLVAFRTLGVPLNRWELRGFATHLGLRTLALLDAVFYLRVKDWEPAPHEEDR